MTAIFGEIGALKQSLDFHTARQELIAGNIANVDTPGYAPKELRRTDKSGTSEFALMLRTTDSQHLGRTGNADTEGFEVQEERLEVPGNDLNYVSLDQEMSRLGANAIRFKVLGNLVTHQLGILRYAAQSGRS